MKKIIAWFFALLLTGSLILFGVCLVGRQVIAPAMGDEGAPVSDSLIREEKDLARERITAWQSFMALTRNRSLPL